uniref:Uncharacterized protein n=1 Tax=Haptolina brevifila TaxID=156173 RepID=A0A7S2JLI1_9EUKA
MQDLFARVGGADGTASDPVGVQTMVHIQSGHVIGDNLWLWRADHAVGGAVSKATNPCDHGIVVDGDDVTMYGLAVEHTWKDLVLWNGDRGKTFFFQSELPYIATQQEFGDPGYAGYHVSSSVKEHGGWGIGVYSNFDAYNVTVQSAIICPPAVESGFVNPLTVKLNGNGGILHIVNNKGNSSIGSGTSVNYWCP